MTSTLLFLCAGATLSSRQGGFASAHEPLDHASRRAAAACQLPARFQGAIVRSPSRSAADTVTAMGLGAAEDLALADLDHGSWSGRSFEAIEAEQPGALGRWLRDPTRGTPGGESMAQAVERIGLWLEDVARCGVTLCAVTHPMLIRAALAHALGMAPAGTLAIDIAPLSRTLLSHHGRWRLQALERAGRYEE